MNSDPQLSPSSGFPRRTFLKGALATSALSLPAVRGFAAPAKSVSANEKVNVAYCGIANRGADDIKGILATGHANIVALCDVDGAAKPPAELLKAYPNLPRFKDFREMFDKMGKQIDAVTVAVPDHTHFPIAMLAMSMGKHVYVEKPLAHTFHEIDLMMAAEKKYKVAAQMGNQGHSGANYYQFKAWTEAGIIRNVTRILAFMNQPRRWHGWKIDGYPTGETLPDTLDWDKWIATAPYHDFSSKLAPGNWRSWYDYGNGALGDWGAHIIDTAHRFLKLGLPEQVGAVKLEGHNRFIFPQASTLSFKFPARDGMPPVEVFWYDGVNNSPQLPADFGEAVLSPDVPPPSSGKLDAKLAPGKVIFGEGLTFKGGSHAATLQIIPKSKMEDMKSKLPPVPKNGSDHYLNFLLACKGHEQCRSSLDISGPLSQVLCLGVIAQRLNATFKFDRQTRQITDNKIANELLVGPPPRKGWEEYYKL